METLHATSEPRRSNKNPNYWWFYYSEATPDGRAKGALLHAKHRDCIQKGTAFDRSQLLYDQELGFEVLTLEDQFEVPEEPALPPDADHGWGDPDNITAVRTATRVASRTVTNGTRGPAHRKQAAAMAGQTLPLDLLKSLSLCADSYKYVCARIGATDPPKSDHARALTITVLIAWMREQGVTPPTPPAAEEESLDPLDRILSMQT
jgi:hypothetical protein